MKTPFNKPTLQHKSGTPITWNSGPISSLGHSTATASPNAIVPEDPASPSSHVYPLASPMTPPFAPKLRRCPSACLMVIISKLLAEKIVAINAVTINRLTAIDYVREFWLE
jgi:hypothetical protein